ncbi:MAG: DUF2764 domain-containing protein [Myxococcota bacterium]|nr:DUF2764 domain-containing protein [Myxococcota bacterium]
MAREAYYTLVASLPGLVHFERAEWLPLSRKQIDQRLSMLSEEDAGQLRLAEALVKWQRQPVTRTTEQMLTGYRLVMQRAENPRLREFVDYRMSQRTALVALRRRRRGMGAPAPGEVWGVGPFVRRIEGAWDSSDLGLGTLFPWIERARALLDEGNALELERLLMDAVWQRLSRMGDAHPFGFEQVFSFVFRWDIVQRWLSHDADAAKTRFQELIAEVTRDHQQLFA